MSLFMEFKDIFHHRIYDFQNDRENPRIIDGGACVGVAALYFKTVYPEASVVCFEPDERTFAILERNIQANKLSNVELVQAGLAQRLGTTGFAPDGADGGRVTNEGAATSVIQTVKLSDYLKDPVDFLKLNIEGLELPVLEEVCASGRFRSIDQLVLEYHGWAEGEQKLGAILSLLNREGFRYLIHDFDAQTCGASKPPFRLRPGLAWHCLVYARQCEAREESIDWGDLRRREPVSRVFGLDRGSPIDRYYIERFLSTNALDVRGRVLEIGDDTYTRRYGGERVTASDVLTVTDGNRCSTLVADLADANCVKSNTFDCIICTQTLQFIYDVQAAASTLHRILAPGGVLLLTVPGISQISRYDMDRWGEYWRFTHLSAMRLMEEVFPAEHIQVETHGNVSASIAFLHGLCAGDVGQAELDEQDWDYPLLITVRAVKAQAVS